jgi:hypothetical protein
MMTTITTDSSVPNYKKIVSAIEQECEKKETKRYSLLSQKSYIFQNRVEQVMELTKCDFHDIVVRIAESDDIVSTTRAVTDTNLWEAMVKYDTGGFVHWRPSGTDPETWRATTKYPEDKSSVTQTRFYSDFFFSVSETESNYNPYERQLVQYNQSSDSFTTISIKPWTENKLIADASDIQAIANGAVTDLSPAIRGAADVISRHSPELSVNETQLLVFETSTNLKLALIGEEVFQKRSSLGKTGFGYRAIFTKIDGTVSTYVPTGTMETDDNPDSYEENDTESTAKNIGLILKPTGNPFLDYIKLSPLSVSKNDPDYFKFTTHRYGTENDNIFLEIYSNDVGVAFIVELAKEDLTINMPYIRLTTVEWTVTPEVHKIPLKDYPIGTYKIKITINNAIDSNKKFDYSLQFQWF